MDGHNSKGLPLMFYDNEWDYGSEETKKFSLGHSCDRWVIGTLDEAVQFHNLLGEMIEKAKSEPSENQSTDSEY